MTETVAQRRAAAVQLFALSFTALFLELMVIRWVPSAVRLVAYYANLMLISSFLGLGVGAMLALRKRSWFAWLPFLVLLDVVFLFVAQRYGLVATGDEKRFYAGGSDLLNYVVLVGTFVFNTAMFVPIGQRIGALFHSLPPLRAYSWDLGGSLTGTIFFGLFSLAWFSPVAGIVLVWALLLLLLENWRQRAWAIPAAIVTLTLVGFTEDPEGIWSPYHYITVHDASSGAPVSEPLPEVRAMRDPPIYEVRVNQDFYQGHGTIDLDRYDPQHPHTAEIRLLNEQYFVPYLLVGRPHRVAVLGAGGGLDVEAALLAGAEEVVAVEIDPVLVEISRRFSASGVYDDSRVRVVVDDARAFLRRAVPGYDVVAFGFLDSQALFSYMSSLRLDGFTYTVQSFRSAFELLNEDGVLAVSFAVGAPWLAVKLQQMVIEATGVEPVVYMSGIHAILCASRRSLPAPDRLYRFQRARASTLVAPAGALRPEDSAQLPVATDDWPYLYLRRRAVPRDYLVVIGSLMALSLLLLLTLRRQTFAWDDGHFVLLGLGFLLLETKSIGDCSLYFGTTWLVTMLVVSGVLLMVLLANWTAMRLERFSFSFYLPLFLSLLLLVFMPRQTVLAWPWAGRLAWTLLAVPLPIFFAGLIFSTTFRRGRVPSALFGSNLIGAMIGGFCEYLGMAIGTSALSWIVVGAYGASLLCLLRAVATRRLAL